MIKDEQAVVQAAARAADTSPGAHQGSEESRAGDEPSEEAAAEQGAVQVVRLPRAGGTMPVPPPDTQRTPATHPSAHDTQPFPGLSLRTQIFVVCQGQPPGTTNRLPSPTANRHQPPTAANHHQPPTANRQPPPTPTNHHQPRTANL